MVTRILTFVLTFLFLFNAHSQVQSPKEYFGYELGEQFTRHHQVVDYFHQVADQSEKVILKKYGETYEKRPLYLAFISTPENLSNLEKIRKDNLKRAGLVEGSADHKISIVWLSYNVHGNESVSTEASMATLYELVRPESDKTSWLENTVVIIDPCVNPDGRERYVNFYWEHANQPFNPNPDSWEHLEPWPNGRANHYLFDLNRDWAWQTQIESKQRIAVYNQWLPQVHVDFHEQGINSPYYFAPAAEPYHELITDWQREFQVEIGKNHAKYFDQNNWFYFTKQYYDLLYPSYGDTYPTYNGAIGMTYEQGGSGRAGVGVIKQEGDTLTLKDRIAHHYTTGLSTIEVTVKNADKVLSEFERFFHQRPEVKYKTYVLKYEGQDNQFKDLKAWLDTQGIQYGSASASKAVSGYHYNSGKTESFQIESKDLVINIDQPKSVLTSVLFEPVTQLADSLTYDITAWSVPYAYGIDAYALTSLVPVTTTLPKIDSKITLDLAYGYIFQWQSMNDARLLAALLKSNIKVRYATSPIRTGGVSFERGSILVTGRDNPRIDNLNEVMSNLANQNQVKVTSLETGWMMAGPDIGSNDIAYLAAPKVALIGGPGTSSLDYGATWHFFEQELGYPVTTLSTDYFKSVNLADYDVLIMPDGWYGDFDDEVLSDISDWVNNGGTLIAVQGALKKWADSDYCGLSRFNSSEEESYFGEIDSEIGEEMAQVPEAARQRYQIREFVAGAVFKIHMDNTHPLAYGYNEEYFSLKTSSNRYALLDEGNVGIIHSSEDHLSGFAGQVVKQKVGNSLVFGVEQKGRGNIVYMADGPLFRSFWHSGKLLFANAVFFCE